MKDLKEKAFIQFALISQKNAVLATNWLCAYCIGIAIFLLTYPDYMINRLEPYFRQVPTNLLAIALLLSAVALLIGMWGDYCLLRRWSTRCLSFVLGGFLTLSMAYHFGTGFPDMSWIHYVALVVMSFMVGLKQIYTDGDDTD